MDTNDFNMISKLNGRNKSALYHKEDSKFLRTINSETRPFSNETDKLPEANVGGNFSSEFSLSKPIAAKPISEMKTASLKQHLSHHKHEDKTPLNRSE